jgi:hypothetical protein
VKGKSAAGEGPWLTCTACKSKGWAVTADYRLPVGWFCGCSEPAAGDKVDCIAQLQTFAARLVVEIWHVWLTRSTAQGAIGGCCCCCCCCLPHQSEWPHRAQCAAHWPCFPCVSNEGHR